MRKLRKKTRQSLMAEMNIVPYVDVMLVLIVILMIAAPILMEGVVVDLPKAAATSLKSATQLPLVVTVDVYGNYFLNVHEDPEAPLSPHNLVLRIVAERKKNDSRPVLVRGDKQVQYGKVMNAMVLLQQAGIEQVGLVTSPLEDKL